MIKQSYKLFYKTKHLFCGFIAFSLFIFIRIFTVLYRWLFVIDYPSADSLLYRTNEMSIFYFILFMLISYELNSILKRNNVTESLEIHNRFRGHFSNIVVLSIFNLFFSIVILVINIVGYCMKFEENVKYLWNISNNIIVYYMLSATLAILIGTIVSNIKDRKISYIVISLFIIIISPIVDILGEVFYGNEIFYKIKWWFSFLPQGLSFVENYYIGFAIQIQKVALLLLWIICCIIILQLLFHSSLKKYILSTLGLCVAILVCMIPGYELAPSYQSDNWVSYAQNYYTKNKIQDMQTSYYFNVDKYDIDFTILNQLYAKVRMSIEEDDLPEYGFTLYHTYDVKSVVDQDGDGLSYIRNGDYLTIVPKNKAISEIVIEYSGTGIPFYSEFCGTFLKSGIAFYPVAGYHTQYENGKFLDVVSEETNFSVKVNSLNDFYCTLNEVSDNQFVGVAESFTLIDGMISIDQIDDVTFVYPTLTAFDSVVEEVERAFIDQMDISREENAIDYSVHNKIVIMDVKTSAEPIASFFDGHMIVYGYQFNGFVEDKYLQQFAKESGENP